MLRIISGQKLLKHRAYLIKKANMSGPDFTLLLQILLSRVTLVSFKDFEPEYHRAMQIMGPIDEKDAPFLAVGLSLGLDAIWTKGPAFSSAGFIESVHNERSY